jgi:ribosomal protein S14
MLIKKTFYDNKKRKPFISQEVNQIILNFILKDFRIRNPLKWFCLIKFTSKNFKSQTIAINKCVITGRSRSLYRFAKISRLFLRENSFINKLPGLRKSYW